MEQFNSESQTVGGTSDSEGGSWNIRGGVGTQQGITVRLSARRAGLRAAHAPVEVVISLKAAKAKSRLPGELNAYFRSYAPILLARDHRVTA